MGQDVRTWIGYQIRQALAEVGGVATEVVQGKNYAAPILGHQCMGRGGDDALDLQVLFQGFEERLDLPAFLVKHGDRVGLRPVVRSQKNQGFAEHAARLPGSLGRCAR